jgi:hypothetical protein
VATVIQHKIMKKQVLNQLESLIKKFNAKNIELNGDEYVMQKPFQYKHGHYSVNIEYKLFYSMDMRDLMEFVIKNNLLLRLGFYENSSQPYMDIQ